MEFGEITILKDNEGKTIAVFDNWSDAENIQSLLSETTGHSFEIDSCPYIFWEEEK